jgi:aspartate aminotransferase
LNIGQPDIKTPEVAMNAVRNFDVKVLEYSHSAGFESYRSKLAQFYTNQGLPINVEDIIITTGGSEALLLQWARWILEMKSSSRTILRKLQWFFCCI